MPIPTLDLLTFCVPTKANSAMHQPFRMNPTLSLPRPLPKSTALSGPICIAALLWSVAHAQSATSNAAAAAPLPQVTGAASVSQTWNGLTSAQKSALAPLAVTWPGLSDAQRRKWLVLAKNFSKLSAPEQEVMHSRMESWAALPPKERETARLNFSQSKAMAQSDREANWKAYQALSPEERSKLAEKGKAKPAGAAVALKPVAPEKLTPAPLTLTPPEKKASALTSVNRNTLLPNAATPPLAQGSQRP